MVIRFYSIIRIDNKPIGVSANYDGDVVSDIKSNPSILNFKSKSFVFNDLDENNQSFLMENAQSAWNNHLEEDNYFCEESEYYEELEQGYSQDR